MKELKVFFVYTIFQVFFIAIGAFLIYSLKSYNKYLIALNIHLLFELASISIFLSIIVENESVKKAIKFLSPFLLIIFILYLVKSNQDFNNYPTIIEFFFFIIILIYYFFEKLNTVSLSPVYNKISFWIAVGLFFYFTGNFFYILLVENSRNESVQVKNQLIIMYSAVTVIKNLILGFAFLLGKEEDDNENNFIPFPSDLDLDATTPNQ